MNGKKKFKAMEMWLLRRVIRISWRVNVTNNKRLEVTSESRTVYTTTGKKQTSSIGHIMRRKTFEKMFTTGNIHSRRDSGRQREVMLDGLRSEHGGIIIDRR